MEAAWSCRSSRLLMLLLAAGVVVEIASSENDEERSGAGGAPTRQAALESEGALLLRLLEEGGLGVNTGEGLALIQRNVASFKTSLTPLLENGSSMDQAYSLELLEKDVERSWGMINLISEEVFVRAVPPHRVLNSVSVDVQYNGILEEMETFPQRQPWKFNVIVATLKTFTADLVVQVGSKSGNWRSRIDWRRSMFFAIFGCIYVGMVQWFFYVSMFSRLCPDALAFANKSLASKLVDRVGQEDLLIQVLVDQMFINPLIYFPTFYIVKEAFGGAYGPTGTVKHALKLYGTNFWQDNIASMSLWFPADFLVFTAPMYMRMPLDHLCSFLWTVIISYMRGGTAAKDSGASDK